MSKSRKRRKKRGHKSAGRPPKPQPEARAAEEPLGPVAEGTHAAAESPDASPTEPPESSAATPPPGPATSEPSEPSAAPSAEEPAAPEPSAAAPAEEPAAPEPSAAAPAEEPAAPEPSAAPRRSRAAKRPSAPGPGPGQGVPTIARGLWLVALLALTAAVYLPSLDNGFTNWDDNIYVTDNSLVQSHDLRALLTTPVAGNLHPLTMWSYVLNHRLSGLDPASYHALNLLLHLANTALVFVFVWILSRGRLWTTVFSTALFGVHPMHVESVAWIAERKDVLYAFFYLLGLIAYLRYLDRARLWWWAASLVAFALSAASKPAAVVFPVTLLAIDWFRRRPLRWRALLEKLPHLAIAVAVGVLTIQAQRAGGAISAEWTAFERVLFASYAVVQYVAKLLVPVHLSAIYPYPPVTGARAGPVYQAAFAMVVVMLPALLLLFRRVRVVLFGLAFFFIHLILVLQLFAVGGAIMADRYTYLPYIGLVLALAWWLDERPAPRPLRLPLKPILAVGLLALLGFSLVQTWKRCEVWRDSGTLWDNTIAEHPGQIVDAYINRGVYLQKEGRQEEALADYDRALALNSHSARTWHARADLLADLGHDAEAITSYDRTLALDPKRANAWCNRGALKYRRNDYAGAIADYSRAIALDPAFRDAYINRSIASFMAHDYEQSVADGRRALELAPDDPQNYIRHGNLGAALQALERPREAIAEYDLAIGGAPPTDAALGSYYLRRSLAWQSLGNAPQALADAEEAQRHGATVPEGYVLSLQGP